MEWCFRHAGGSVFSSVENAMPIEKCNNVQIRLSGYKKRNDVLDQRQVSGHCQRQCDQGVSVFLSL